MVILKIAMLSPFGELRCQSNTLIQNENLKHVIKISKNENEKTLLLNNGSIKFKNVSFNYLSNTENKVFKNINIEINGEKMTALVGHSGSGKSTMLNLIPRIYDPIS